MNGQMQLAGAVRWRIALNVGIGLLVTFCYVLQGIFLAFALAALFMGSPASDVIWWIVGFAIVVVVRGALVWSAEMAAQATAQSTKEHLRERLLSHLIDLGPGMVLRRQTGDL